MRHFEESKLGFDALAAKIATNVKGLFYISETDAEVVPFSGGRAEAVTREDILRATKSDSNLPVEERDFDDFFDQLSRMQYLFEESAPGSAQKFAEVKDLMERNLRDLTVYKIGRIRIDIYAVGLDTENNLIGIKTFAVET